MNQQADTSRTHKTSSLTVWLLLLPLVVSGCRNDTGPQHDKVIQNGMPIDQVLTLLRQEGLNPQETMLEMERVNGKPFDMYVLEPSTGKDVLYFTSSANQDGVMTLDSMFWWVNGATDGALPKAQRVYNQMDTDQITINTIKSRLRGEEVARDK